MFLRIQTVAKCREYDSENPQQWADKPSWKPGEIARQDKEKEKAYFGPSNHKEINPEAHAAVAPVEQNSECNSTHCKPENMKCALINTHLENTFII